MLMGFEEEDLHGMMNLWSYSRDDTATKRKGFVELNFSGRDISVIHFCRTSLSFICAYLYHEFAVKLVTLPLLSNMQKRITEELG